MGTQVLALTQSENSDARDLAQRIHNDQSMASYERKVANSAAFSSKVQIQPLQHAIIELGMKNISEMALSISVGKNVFKAGPVTIEIIQYLWRHLLACAFAGSIITGTPARVFTGFD